LDKPIYKNTFGKKALEFLWTLSQRQILGNEDLNWEIATGKPERREITSEVILSASLTVTISVPGKKSILNKIHLGHKTSNAMLEQCIISTIISLQVQPNHL